MARITALSLGLFASATSIAQTMDFPCTGEISLAINGDELILPIEIAGTPSEQAYGLMFRKELPDDLAMLFVFPQVQPRAFWMKNTILSLDIAFYDGSGAQVALHEDTVPLSLTALPSPPASLVLETLAGRYPEDRVRIEYFSVDDDQLCSKNVLEHPLRVEN